VLILSFFKDSSLTINEWRALGPYLQDMDLWGDERVPKDAVGVDILPEEYTIRSHLIKALCGYGYDALLHHVRPAIRLGSWPTN
jgi:hypothetical protein